MKRYQTTPGRLRIGALLPKNFKTPFDIVNRLLRKKEVGEVIDTVYRHCGQKESVIFCDRIMSLGFTEAFRAGISFGKDDMLIPERKWPIVNRTRDQVKEFEQQYMDGLITQGEKYNKVVDAWSKCSDDVAEAMMSEISAARKDEPGRELEPNSVYMMSHSGARGSPAQMKQLGGMRGLMAKPSGEIIETPIVSNFKEGLTVLEYFNSTHGARKGLADTALKTANSGYLTRRLVDVAQDCIVKEDDCGTDRSITARAAINDGEVVASLSERILGRVAAEDVHDPKTQEVIFRRGDLIDERAADAHRGGGRARDADPQPAHLRGRGRHLRQVLRARPRPRHHGQPRRGGGHHRRAVDRRARHPADDADLPHRRHRARRARSRSSRRTRRARSRSATATFLPTSTASRS